MIVLKQHQEYDVSRMVILNRPKVVCYTLRLYRWKTIVITLSVNTCFSSLDDAEHPTNIPMYSTTTPQAPSAHMLRPRAYAIGPKVNSLLSESSLSACKTWMLL